MREYKVRYYIDDAEMMRGEKPHSEVYEELPVDASSADEAIELVKDYLRDQVIQNSEYTADIEKDRVVVTGDDGEAVESYYGFSCECAIRAARQEVGLSRAEMSRIFEIPLRTLENWESGNRMPAHWAEKLIVEKLESMKHDREEM